MNMRAYTKEQTEEMEMQAFYNSLSLEDRQLYHELRGFSPEQLKTYKEAQAMISMFNNEENKSDKRLDIHHIRNWRGGLVSCLSLIHTDERITQIKKAESFGLLEYAIKTNHDNINKRAKRKACIERTKMNLFKLGVPERYLWKK